ncbi:signal peptidase I [Arthrobacter sp. NPDC093139]|uniref:signal peptidase I n=1 Tax=Arthrobacter sp. NPDC093139 TaxID=3363945 RepID=UPI0038256B14
MPTPPQPSQRFAGSPLKRAVGRAGSWGLTLLSVLGAGCVASVIASALFSVSFVVFRTGSMEPAYPVGALAAVRDVPASSLRPGDVATVQRTAASVPVTHRVVSVTPDAASAGGAVLILKGDANKSEDPVEYRVQSARKMLVAVPGAGSVVMGLRSPTVLGASTLLLAGLVGWVFWPRRPQVAPDAARPAEDQAARAGEAPCGTSTLP